MNEPTEAGGINEALRRRFGVPGQVGPIITLASDLFPIVTLDEARMDPELLFLTGARRASSYEFINPGAGEIGMVGIFSPPAGNTLVVIERVFVVTDAASAIQFRTESPGVTAISNTQSGTPHDSRWGTALSTALVGSGSLAANAGSLQGILVCDGDGILDTPWEHVIAPGGNFMVQGPVDANLDVTIFWRERRMTSWEITR